MQRACDGKRFARQLQDLNLRVINHNSLASCPLNRSGKLTYSFTCAAFVEAFTTKGEVHVAVRY